MHYKLNEYYGTILSSGEQTAFANSALVSVEEAYLPYYPNWLYNQLRIHSLRLKCPVLESCL